MSGTGQKVPCSGGWWWWVVMVGAGGGPESKTRNLGSQQSKDCVPACKSFLHLQNLTNLDLSFNFIKKIPDKIFYNVPIPPVWPQEHIFCLF